MRELVVVSLSYLVLVALHRLIGVALVKLFARLGPWVERMRTRWIDPPREAARAIRALLVLSLLVQATRLLALPKVAAYPIYAIWALNLAGELRTRLACKKRPHATLALHERGFFLLDHGPLETRLLLTALIWVCHEFIPSLARGMGFLTGGILAGVHWLLF